MNAVLWNGMLSICVNSSCAYGDDVGSKSHKIFAFFSNWMQTFQEQLYNLQEEWIVFTLSVVPLQSHKSSDKEKVLNITFVLLMFGC